MVKSVLASTVLYSALQSSQDVPHVPLTVQSWTLTVGDRRKAFTSKHVFLMRSHWNFSRWLRGRPTTVPSFSIYRLQREVCWRLRDLEMTFNFFQSERRQQGSSNLFWKKEHFLCCKSDSDCHISFFSYRQRQKTSDHQNNMMFYVFISAFCHYRVATENDT